MIFREWPLITLIYTDLDRFVLVNFSQGNQFNLLIFDQKRISKKILDRITQQQFIMILKLETQEIIGACMEVHNNLGHGFAEVLYQDALELELSTRDIPFERERKFEVLYKGTLLPHYYFADFVVMDKIIVELKCVKEFNKEHFSQILNYLKISKCRVGLLFNFSRGSLEWKRLIL